MTSRYFTTDIEDLVPSPPPALCIELSHDDGHHRFSDSEIAGVRESLVEWYRVHRRRLPWRGDPPPYAAGGGKAITAASSSSASASSYAAPSHAAPSQDAVSHYSCSGSPPLQAPGGSVSPYATWVSEIMLQQTRVDTVVKYFTRWMDKFPTVEHLAAAPAEEVNAAWAGLGYYRRSRFLHDGARVVVKDHAGRLPSTVKGLCGIPGIGPYTAGAVASIAFGRQAPIVDGNVIRVLSRLRAVAASPKSSALVKLSWELAAALVAEAAAPGDLNQALMELGATVCTPSNPQCGACPVKTHCLASRQAAANERRAAPAVVLPAMALPAARVGKGKAPAHPSGLRGCTVCEWDHPTLAATTAGTRAEAGAGGAGAAAEAGGGAAPAEATLFMPPRQASFYPLPTQRKPPREENWTVGVFERRCPAEHHEDQHAPLLSSSSSSSSPSPSVSSSSDSSSFLLVRRPKKGLLAGQWELPSVMSSTRFPHTPTYEERTADIATYVGSLGHMDVLGLRGEGRGVGSDEGGGGIASDTVNAGSAFSWSIMARLDHHQHDHPLHATDNNGGTKKGGKGGSGAEVHVFSHVKHHMYIESIVLQPGHCAAPGGGDGGWGNLRTLPTTKTSTSTRTPHTAILEEGTEMEEGAGAEDGTPPREVAWMTTTEMEAVGVTAGLKKVLRAIRGGAGAETKSRGGGKATAKARATGKGKGMGTGKGTSKGKGKGKGKMVNAEGGVSAGPALAERKKRKKKEKETEATDQESETMKKKAKKADSQTNIFAHFASTSLPT